MKKNMFGKVVLLFLSLSVFFLFSACQMFTTSLGKAFQRNQQDFLKRAEASDLLVFMQGANASNPDTMKAVLNLLSDKSSEELRDLSLSEKETALTLTLDATLPMEKVSEIAAQASDLASGAAPDKAGEVVKKLLGDIDTFNTKASVQLLSDPEAMRKADPNVLANAAVAVMLQVTAKNGGYDKIKQNIQGNGSVDFQADTADQIVNKMLNASASEDDKNALKAAVNAVKLLSGADNAVDGAGKPVPKRDIDPKEVKLLGLMPLGDILGAF